MPKITPLTSLQGIEYVLAEGSYRKWLMSSLKSEGFTPASAEDIMYLRYISCTLHNKGGEGNQKDEGEEGIHRLLWQNSFHASEGLSYRGAGKAVITVEGRHYELNIPAQKHYEPEREEGLAILVWRNLLSDKGGDQHARLEAYVQAWCVHMHDGDTHDSKDFMAANEMLMSRQWAGYMQRTIPVVFAPSDKRQNYPHGLCIGPQGEGIFDSWAVEGEFRPRYMIGFRPAQDAPAQSH